MLEDTQLNNNVGETHRLYYSFKKKTWHSHYGGDADIRLQRPRMLSPNDPIVLLIVSAVTQWPHIFADYLCCHPKTPYFWWNVSSSIALTQRPPIFWLWLPQKLLLFVSISSTNWSFSMIFFFFLQIPPFKALTERSKVTFSPNAHYILNQNLTSHPMTPHFLRLCSHRMPNPLEVWALHLYLFDTGVPPGPPLPIETKISTISLSLWGHYDLIVSTKKVGKIWYR